MTKHSLFFTAVLSAFLLLSGCGTEVPNPEPDPEEKSPFITKVFEYKPAPGQFVNKLPKYETGDSPEIMAKKALDAIGGDNKGVISLGGFGGYVVVGFDHTIENKPNARDFQVLGNAFEGSSEPGIVMVSVDKNKNGKPDDEWYELAGSEYDSKSTIHNYKITYFKPDENKTPVPHDKYEIVTDITYIKWNASGNTTGFMHKNKYHTQSYWPQWLPNDELSFTGTKLADNATDKDGTGEDFALHAYEWGYADNASNNEESSKLDIDWAVDKNGTSVKLAGIDFVKIYTGLNQQSGWLGETSTEVSGVVDLHLITK